MVYTVKRSIPDTPIYSRMPVETHDYVPDVADSYTVTFVRGRSRGEHPKFARRSDLHTVDIGRIVVRDVPTLLDAFRIAYDMDAEHGAFGRRALIQAVKGCRGHNVPRW